MPEQTEAQREREEIRALVEDVILNVEAQQKWVDECSELFLDSVDAYSRHIMSADKKSLLRIGVIIGATYEKWRQARKESQL